MSCSSNSSPPLVGDAIPAKRARKSAEPQRVPTEPTLPTMLGATGGGGTDPLAFFNLASQLAMNSLMASMQQQQQQQQQQAANPLLQPAALLQKMLLLQQLQQQQAAAAQAAQHTEVPEVGMGLPGLQQALLMQQYAQQLRGRSMTMSLKRIPSDAVAGVNLRKRSLPPEAESCLHDDKQKLYSDASAFRAQLSDTPAQQHPVTKDDMEKCLHKILKEEIYNIFEEELKEEKCEKEQAEGKENGEMEEEVEPFDGRCVQDVLEACAERKAERKESAFRKVLKKVKEEEEGDAPAPDDDMYVAVSPDAGPVQPEDVAPVPASVLDTVRALAERHRREVGGFGSMRREEQMERFPVIWQGIMAMKAWETNVQMHMVYGAQDIVKQCMAPAPAGGKQMVRINQRMRMDPHHLQGMAAKMMQEKEWACMICLPCGETREEILINSRTFQQQFIDYLSLKGAAGIANMPAGPQNRACLVHIFSPGEFASGYLRYYSPELYDTIIARNASYLFVVLTPEDAK